MVLELIEPKNHLYYAAEEIYYTDNYIYKLWLNIGNLYGLSLHYVLLLMG